MREIKRYGWIPDLPDQRDRSFALMMAVLPAHVDLRPQMPPVYDQGALGSCTGNAVAGALQFDRRKQGLTDFALSRLFLYYNGRALEGTTRTDAGAMIRDVVKGANTWGAPSEADWPYDIRKFAKRPERHDYQDALETQALRYQRIDNRALSACKACLASGFPFVFGFSVYESFQSGAVASSGVVPIPGPNEGLLGGHAVVAVGYDDASSRFIVRNSWGEGWGDAGYCTMPYDYLTNPNLADDFWQITFVG